MRSFLFLPPPDGPRHDVFDAEFLAYRLWALGRLLVTHGALSGNYTQAGHTPKSRRDCLRESVGEILVFGRTKVLEREYHQHLVARGRPGVAAGPQFRSQGIGERGNPA